MKEKIDKPKSKRISEVFSDYKTNSSIADVEILKLNLLKKQNILEIEVYAKEYVEIKEVWYFEKFLRERFQFGQVHIIIKYEEGVHKKSIETEWENLICYMAHKYPLMRPLLLLKSEIEVTVNKINVYMKIKGAEFLKARKLDKELEKVIQNIFGKIYTINIEEKITQKEVERFKEQAREIENQAVQDAMRGMAIRTHQEDSYYNNSEQHQAGENIPDNYMEGEIPPPIPQGVYNDADYVMPSDEDARYRRTTRKYNIR